MGTLKHSEALLDLIWIRKHCISRQPNRRVAVVEDHYLEGTAGFSDEEVKINRNRSRWR
jgi:hypothetical protein